MGWSTYCVQIEGTDMSLGPKLNVVVSSAMCMRDIYIWGNVRACYDAMYSYNRIHFNVFM